MRPAIRAFDAGGADVHRHGGRTTHTTTLRHFGRDPFFNRRGASTLSGELNHTLSKVGGPTQCQLSRPTSRHNIPLEHRPRRKQSNSDTNVSIEMYFGRKNNGEKRITILEEEMKWTNEKHETQHTRKSSFLRQELFDTFFLGFLIFSDDWYKKKRKRKSQKQRKTEKKERKRKTR